MATAANNAKKNNPYIAAAASDTIRVPSDAA